MIRTNSNLGIALAAAAVLAIALLFFRLAVYQRPAPATPVPAKAAATARAEAVVLSVSGEVQAGQGGSWAAVSAGQRLGVDSQVRTGKGARTEVRVGLRDRITMSESTELTIKDLTQEVRRLRLTRGRITVDEEDAQGPPLRVEDANGAVAEGRRARFSVLSTGTAIAVATEKGEVALTSGLRTVAVAPGMESVAFRGRAPQPPRPVSRRILMQVANAVVGASAEVCAELDGSVPSGAELLVDGIPTLPDDGGRFHLKVPRARGKQSVSLELRDAAGRTRTREVPCAPSPAEVRDVAIKWRELQ